MYGFETNTGVKFVAVVDMRGRKIVGDEGAVDVAAKAKGKSGATGGGVAAGMVGLREGEMKIVCSPLYNLLLDGKDVCVLDCLHLKLTWCHNG